MRIHLASTRVRRIRSVYPEISVYAVYPDTCGRSYPYIFVYADVTVSEPVLMRMLCWLILWDVRIQIGYVWTVVYVWTQIILYLQKKNLRIQKSPDTCGQGLKGIATGHQIEYLVPRKEEGALISLKAHH